MIGAFYRWIESHGGRISDKIELRTDESGGGRTFYAVQDLEEGEDVFDIPKELALSPQRSGFKSQVLASTAGQSGSGLENQIESQKESRHDSDADSDAGSQTAAEEEGWVPLMLTILLELERGAFWKPYLDILPRDMSHMPTLWDEETRQMLKGSSLLDKLGDLRSDFEAKFAKRAQGLFGDKDAEELYAMYHYAGCLISSYSFSDEDGQVMMVPVADLFNHSSTCNNVRLYFSKERIRMCSVCRIQRGQELFNTYGELPNFELLRRYGFVDPNNPFNCAEVSAKHLLTRIGGVDEERTEMLLDEGVLDDVFVIEKDGLVPNELVASVNVLLMSDRQFAEFQKKRRFDSVVHLKSGTREVLRSVLEDRLAEFGPAQAVDDQTDARSAANNALRVVQEERKILEECYRTMCTSHQ